MVFFWDARRLRNMHFYVSREVNEGLVLYWLDSLTFLKVRYFHAVRGRKVPTKAMPMNKAL